MGPLFHSWFSGVNSFGFGGANGHVLLKWNSKTKIRSGEPEDNTPRLICASGRTEESVVSLFDDLTSRALDVEHVSLLHNIFRWVEEEILHCAYS